MSHLESLEHLGELKTQVIMYKSDIKKKITLSWGDGEEGLEFIIQLYGGRDS